MNDLAFPVVGVLNEDNPDAKMGVYNPGLTKRELYAVMALQGFNACQGSWEEWSNEDVAKYAVLQADALIEALKEVRQ